MRKSNEEAGRTRARIVETAADHLKRTGVAEASLADIMAAAGLTHGGFYRHFRSKEHLVSEALAEAGRESVATMRGHVEKGGIAAAAASYLSVGHRDAATPLCPFAAYGSEMRHIGRDGKAAAGESVEALIAALSSGLTGSADARREAIVSLAILVGAMTLARAVADPSLSDEILASAQQALVQ